jgi:putative Mg2+ transporter-C (MgtC) family protein
VVPVLTTIIVSAQIALAIVLGAAIGLERELSAQPAGLRTHMLVALGGVIVTLAGAHAVASNPATLAAPVITGVGFLGGGAILREGTGVRGLTTAASLWVTAAVGVAVGLRQWLPSIAATVLAIGVLLVVKRLEHETLPHRRPVELTLTLDCEASIHEVEHLAREVLRQGRVLRINYTGTEQQILMVARPKHHHSLAEISERLRELAGVKGVDMTR